MRNTPPTRRVRGAHESRSATVRAAAAAPSRRQQTRWQREQHQRRMLFVAGGVLVVVVLLILAAGLVYDNVFRANQTVAQIGPDSITASQLVAEMQPSARAIDAQAKQVGGTNTSAFADQQKRGLPDQTLNDLIDEHLIQQEANRRGISVSPAEVDDRERQAVADYNAAVNPAPTPAPTGTPQPTPTAAGAAAAGASPTAATSPTPVPSPTPNPTLDASAYGPALQQLLDRNYLTEAEFRQRLERNLLREKVQTAIGQEQVPATQDEVHARQIVVATEDAANNVLQQLQGGADFAQLAQQLSTDTSTNATGGDLGWVARGVKDPAFDETAFALQPGQLSNPVHLSTAYAVIQVLERDPNHAVSASDLATARDKAFSDWLGNRRSSQDVKLALNGAERDWVLSRIGVRP